MESLRKLDEALAKLEKQLEESRKKQPEKKGFLKVRFRRNTWLETRKNIARSSRDQNTQHDDHDNQPAVVPASVDEKHVMSPLPSFSYLFEESRSGSDARGLPHDTFPPRSSAAIGSVKSDQDGLASPRESASTHLSLGGSSTKRVPATLSSSHTLKEGGLEKPRETLEETIRKMTTGKFNVVTLDTIKEYTREQSPPSTIRPDLSLRPHITRPGSQPPAGDANSGKLGPHSPVADASSTGRPANPKGLTYSREFLTYFFANLKRKPEGPGESEPKPKVKQASNRAKGCRRAVRARAMKEKEKKEAARKANIECLRCINELATKKGTLYSAIEDVTLRGGLQRIDMEMLERFSAAFSVPREHLVPLEHVAPKEQQTKGLRETLELEDRRVADIVDKYFNGDQFLGDREEIKRKIRYLTKKHDFVQDLLSLVDAGKGGKGDDTSAMIERIIMVLNKGDVKSDARFLEILDKSISTLSRSKDPFTCQVAVNIAICKKYVEDFIELKGIVEEFIRLKL